MIRFIHEVVSLETTVASHAMMLESSRDPIEQRAFEYLLNWQSKSLATHYAEIGFAHGKHEAKQLVEQLIVSARSQAPGKSDLGRG